MFDHVDRLYYKNNKISFRRAGSYLDSPERLKNEKATIYPQQSHENFFQYAITAALNHEKIKKHPQRITKIRPIKNQCDWKDMKFPIESKDWKKFETNKKQSLLMFCSNHILRKK